MMRVLEMDTRCRWTRWGEAYHPTNRCGEAPGRRRDPDARRVRGGYCPPARGNANRVFGWRKLYQKGQLGAMPAEAPLLPVQVTDEVERRRRALTPATDVTATRTKPASWTAPERWRSPAPPRSGL